MKPLTPFLAALAVVLGCTDEPTATPVELPVPERATAFGPPILDASGFAGYRVPGMKLTACAECHRDNHLAWVTTLHADALQNQLRTDIELLYCRPCHTVNGFGNPVNEPAGYDVVRSRRFADVQCESCHGPGEAHLNDPYTALAFPLASLNAGPDLSWGCGECHTEAHHPFVEQWAESDHAQVSDATAGRDECDGCHEGRAALLETL